MSKAFKVTPKRVKKTNGTVLTPEMSITVTTLQHTSDPFYNGAKEK
jgi:predicted enzyme related to lactoylglutathione lyase